MSESETGTPRRLTVGVVGQADLVEEIINLSGTLDDGTLDLQLVGIGYRGEANVAREYFRAQPGLDVSLFAGPLPYDLARQDGEVTTPSTFVPLSGSALYAALLRGMLRGDCDVTRVSIDSLPHNEVLDAYTDLGVDPGGVHVREYDGPESIRGYVDFHRRLWESGAASAALTSVRSVADELVAAGIPTLPTTPTRSTIRTALRTAVLLGVGARLEESQIAMAVVELPRSSGPGDDYADRHLRLALHRILLDEGRRMDATVLQRDDRSWYVIATLGPLLAATEGLSEPPFVDRLQHELGLRVRLGVGLGTTAHEAQIHAQQALEHHSPGAPGSFVVSDRGHLPVLGAYTRGRLRARHDEDTKSLEILARVVDAVQPAGAGDVGAVLVDAGTVAAALEVTPRAAQRMLNTLASAGLAWPMPPAPPSGPGRPRRPFRLRTERLPI